MVNSVTIHGDVEPGFERVADRFARSFDFDELGAAVCAYVGGRKVVDLWGGWADEAKTRPWQRDTIAATFSATKGMTTTAVLQLVEQGRLELDAPLADHWPEFAQAGKEGITLRMVLTHQAGVLWATAPYPAEERLVRSTITDALARSAPVYEPGTKSEYHGGTFGYLAGTVLERVDGRALRDYFREEIAEPLGADYLIGFGPEEDHRCADMVGEPDMVGGSNTRAWRQADDGSATGSGTAESLARVYAALAGGGELDGVRVLRPETIEAATQEQRLQHADGAVQDFGLGYQFLWKQWPGLGTTAFGHTGLGGAIGLADPAVGLGFGFVMNRMGSGGAARPLGAIYAALG